MRRPLIAGNWKMHKTLGEAVELAKGIRERLHGSEVEVALCPPFTALKSVMDVLLGSGIKLGAQNVHYEDWGAFTGEISPLMLRDLGVEYVIVGHSERRHIFSETDQIINKKVHKLMEKGLVPILCVGETLQQREEGKTGEVVNGQVTEGLRGLEKEQVERIVIAYEPVWAIGTGRSATAEEANRVIGYIREVIGTLAGKDTAERVRVLYGGSVKPGNAAGILRQPQVDGALVGGASLKVEDFLSIIEQAK